MYTFWVFVGITETGDVVNNPSKYPKGLASMPYNGFGIQNGCYWPCSQMWFSLISTEDLTWCER